MDFEISFMQPEDWAAVREIYGEGIATRNATFETELPDWEEMGRRASQGLPFGCAGGRASIGMGRFECGVREEGLSRRCRSIGLCGRRGALKRRWQGVVEGID